MYICAGKNEFQHPKSLITFTRAREEDEEEGKEEDARMGGGSNKNNSEEEEEAELKNYTSTNPIFDQAVENAKKTETEMETWIANATNASVTFIDEVVSAIEDVATSGHFNVSSSSNSEETNEESTTTVVPVVQELQNDLEAEEEKKFEILRNVPEFRYRSSGALGGASTSDFSKSSIPSASKSAMLLQNVNEYDRKDFFVFGTLSMAFCVAFFVAVVLRKHAQKFKVVAAGEETTSEEEKEEEEEEALMRNEHGTIKYGSVV